MCIHDPLLGKIIYGMLLDEGYRVGRSEHPAQAIQQTLKCRYGSIIMDAQAFGMPAEDAMRIIKTVFPEMKIIYLGCPETETDSLSIDLPVDLERLRDVVHAVHDTSAISYT